ncbi:MAG TPA: VOC family protein [Candidatus Saccharibacteria bacterium]|nr:VOC family protein [Candidatus Saccharibacteria bacterium]
MKMKSVAGIIFLVSDLDRSIEFYKTLGFEFKKQNPGISAHAYLNWFWIELLPKDKVVTEEFKADAVNDQKGRGQYLHINVGDVDTFYKDVIVRGLKPSNQPADFPWGHREFVLDDPDGYKLVFFSKSK